MGTLKPQYNCNTMIGTLAVDGRAATYSVAGEAWAKSRTKAPLSPLLAVPNVTAHLSTASVLTQCGTIITFTL